MCVFSLIFSSFSGCGCDDFCTKEEVCGQFPIFEMMGGKNKLLQERLSQWRGGGDEGKHLFRIPICVDTLILNGLATVPLGIPSALRLTTRGFV